MASAAWDTESAMEVFEPTGAGVGVGSAEFLLRDGADVASVAAMMAEGRKYCIWPETAFW